MLEEKFALMKTLLQVAGVRLGKDGNWKKLYRGVQWLRYFYHTAVLLVDAYRMISQEEVHQILRGTVVFQTLVCGLFNVMTFHALLHWRDLESLFAECIAYFSARKLTSDTAIFEKDFEVLWKYIISYWRIIGTFPLVAIVIPVLLEGVVAMFITRAPFRLPLALSGFLPVDVQRSLFFYFVTLAGAVWYALSSLYHVGLITLYFLIAGLVGIELKCLAHKVKQLNHNNFHTEFPILVKEHRKILRLYRIANNFFGFSHLCHNLTITISLCLNLYIVSVTSLDDVYLITWALLLLFFSTTFLFTCSFFAEFLLYQGEGLTSSMMSVPWYDLPLRERKDFLLMLVVAQKPVAATYRSITMQNFEIFAQISNTAYSYFTVLKSLS